MLKNSQERCFPNICARRPLLASKNNHGFSYPCSRKYTCPDDGYPELKLYISKLVTDC